MTYDQEGWLGLFLVFCVSVIYQPKTGNSSHTFIVVSAKTTELLQLTNPFWDTSLNGGLFFGNYFTIVLPGRFRILTAGLPSNHKWPNSVAQEHSVKFWVDINIRYFVVIMHNKTEVGSWFLEVEIFDWKEMMILLLCSREGKYLQEREKTSLCCPL